MPSPADHTLVQPDYATKSVTYLRKAVIKMISLVPKGANGERWLLFKSADAGDVDSLHLHSPLIKRHVPEDKKGVWREAFIRIATPGEEDLQKDIWSEEEIEKAFESFKQHGEVVNWNHESEDSRGRVNHNAIALADFEIDTADGTKEVIKKGTWYMSVIPDDAMRSDIEAGLVGGMSVQGSAERVPVDESSTTSGAVAKADKSDQPVAIGTTGGGVTKLQRVLGVEESGKYNAATETALIEWMKGRGVPGLPTIATVKLALTDSAAPAAPATLAAPVEGGTTVAEKNDDAYNPAAQDNVPPRPVGAPGVNSQTVNPDSSTEDLKALIAQAIREGNEGLEKYMADKYGGATVGDLYNQDVKHEDLWFLVSKFILGTSPSIDENGDYEARAPEVEKGAWTGSHGGHDPDAYKGGMQNLVRSFGKWAKGSQAVAAEKLLRNGVVKTPQAANRLAAWLKDQWLGSTDWRKGNQKSLHKSETEDLRTLLESEGERVDEVVAKMSEQGLFDALSLETPEQGDGVEKSPDALSQITEALAQAQDDPAAAVAQIKQILAGPQEAEKSEDPTIAALKAALTSAVAEEDPAARAAAVETIVQEFARYKVRKGNPKDSTAAAADSESKAPAYSGAPARVATFLNKGEEMDRTLIDDETAERIAQAAQFITTALAGGSSEDEVPAEVEKDDVPDQLKGKMAPPFTPKDGGPADEAAPADETDSPKEGTPEDALDDEGEDVTETELLEVMNHLVEELDEMKSDIAELKSLNGKLDKVGELAKALTASDEVTDKVNEFAAELSEISKSVSSVATQEEVESLRKSLDSVAKRLDGIAKTPNRSGAIPVDAPKAPTTAPQAVAKSATDLENPWSDPDHNPFR